MFTYVDPQPGSHTLEELLEEYWDLLQDYQVTSNCVLQFCCSSCVRIYLFSILVLVNFNGILVISKTSNWHNLSSFSPLCDALILVNVCIHVYRESLLTILRFSASFMAFSQHTVTGDLTLNILWVF